MKLLRLMGALALGLSTAACSMQDDGAAATRNRPLDQALTVPVGVVAAPSYTVTNVVALVPASLRVSERNGYYPMTDIVWRGDPVGDRRMQIASMFEEAAARGAETLTGDRDVVAEVVLSRFHGVTERTRYSVGGVYNIEFTLTVKDALTGEILEGPRFVEADLPAPGGNAAVALEAAGQTERVRVTDFLTMVLIRELTGQSTPI
jgi:hypothetical protein